jgi:hypothetical protein
VGLALLLFSLDKVSDFGMTLKSKEQLAGSPSTFDATQGRQLAVSW